jgi:hypothetical protein
MKKTIATYESKDVFVYHLSRTGHYGLISYKDDDTGKFKVNISDIKDLQTIDVPDPVVEDEEVKEGDQ